jgi:hypothetical protein
MTTMASWDDEMRLWGADFRTREFLADNSYMARMGSQPLIAEIAGRYNGCGNGEWFNLSIIISPL